MHMPNFRAWSLAPEHGTGQIIAELKIGCQIYETKENIWRFTSIALLVIVLRQDVRILFVMVSGQN